MTSCEFDFDLKIKYIIIFDGLLGPSFPIEKSNENPIFKCNKKNTFKLIYENIEIKSYQKFL